MDCYFLCFGTTTICGKQVLALSAGFIVYVNVAFTALFAMVLGMIPCSKKGGATRSTFWDFVVSVAGD